MSLFDRFLSSMIQHGVLTVTLHDGQVRTYGKPAEGYPNIAVRMADSRVARDIALKPELGALMKAELERIVAVEGLSKNVYELATRALN